MVTIAVCDNEELMRNHISALTKIILKKESVEHSVATFSCGMDLLDCIVKEGMLFDVIFLDIELGDSNGLKISKQITDKFPLTQIIYVTAFVEYARNIGMTKFSSFLVKPVNGDNLQFVLDNAVDSVTKLRSTHITISSNNDVVTINTNEIKYCESYKRLLIFNTLSGTVQSYMRINEIIDELPQNFCLIHRSFIVNFDYVNSISPYSIRITDGTMLPVPQKRYKEVKNHYIEYVKSNF